ncbi:MAG: type 1 periplasmic binding fold superfamily protein, partial [Bacteroidota bacterium]
MKSVHTNCVLFFLISFFFSACSKNDSDSITVDPESWITTVRLNLFDGVETKVIQWRDLDGAWGNDPIITSDT